MLLTVPTAEPLPFASSLRNEEQWPPRPHSAGHRRQQLPTAGLQRQPNFSDLWNTHLRWPNHQRGDCNNLHRRWQYAPGCDSAVRQQHHPIRFGQCQVRLVSFSSVATGDEAALLPQQPEPHGALAHRCRCTTCFVCRDTQLPLPNGRRCRYPDEDTFYRTVYDGKPVPATLPPTFGCSRLRPGALTYKVGSRGSCSPGSPGTLHLPRVTPLALPPYVGGPLVGEPFPWQATFPSGCLPCPCLASSCAAFRASRLAWFGWLLRAATLMLSAAHHQATVVDKPMHRKRRRHISIMPLPNLFCFGARLPQVGPGGSSASSFTTSTAITTSLVADQTCSPANIWLTMHLDVRGCSQILICSLRLLSAWLHPSCPASHHLACNSSTLPCLFQHPIVPLSAPAA